MGYIKSELEISENEYYKLITARNNSAKCFHGMVEEIAYRSAFPPNAYECTTPMDVREDEKEGKYYASWYHWDSCD